MSIVTVQLGQCGNQIGHEVFSALCSDIRGTHGLCSKKENQSYQDSCKERFFCEEESADALLVHENDVIHKICAQLMNIKQISFRDVNQVLAHQLGSVFQPAQAAGGGSGYSRNPLGDLMETLVPHPEFRMLGLRNIPQMPESSLPYSTFSWPGLLKHLRQMLIANAPMEEGSFQDPSLYTSWLNPQDAFTAWKTPRAFNKYEKSAALVSNSQFLLKPLDSIVGKAWNMFASKAYLHQYTKFGIQEEDFLDCFTTLEQVISSYTNL